MLFDLYKTFHQISEKTVIFLDACATCIELPSIISTTAKRVFWFRVSQKWDKYGKLREYYNPWFVYTRCTQQTFYQERPNVGAGDRTEVWGVGFPLYYTPIEIESHSFTPKKVNLNLLKKKQFRGWQVYSTLCTFYLLQFHLEAIECLEEVKKGRN